MKFKLTFIALACILAGNPLAQSLSFSPSSNNEYQSALKYLLQIQQSSFGIFDQIINSLPQQVESSMYQELKAQRPDQPDDMLRKFAKTYSQVTIEKIGPELKNMLSQATLKFAEETYSQAFTEQEVIELAAFYQTPTGQKMLTQLPKVMQHLANNMQNLGQTLQKSAENIIQAQEKAIMDETIRRLEAQH